MNQVSKTIATYGIAAAAATLLNYLAYVLFFRILGLPLFMDTVFTLAVTFLLGAWCGILSAVIGAVSWALTHNDPPINMLYLLCAIAAVLITDYFHRHYIDKEITDRESFLNRITSLLLLAASMCVIMSVLGGLIAVCIRTVSPEFQPIPSPEDYFKLGLLLNNVPLLVSEIAARIPINIVERLVSVFCAYALAILGKRFLSR